MISQVISSDCWLAATLMPLDQSLSWTGGKLEKYRHSQLGCQERGSVHRCCWSDSSAWVDSLCLSSLLSRGRSVYRPDLRFCFLIVLALESLSVAFRGGRRVSWLLWPLFQHSSCFLVEVTFEVASPSLRAASCCGSSVVDPKAEVPLRTSSGRSCCQISPRASSCFWRITRTGLGLYLSSYAR